jgi:hypothetical protein
MINERIQYSLTYILKYGSIILGSVLFTSYIYGGKVAVSFITQSYTPETLIFSELKRDTSTYIIRETIYKTSLYPKGHVILFSPFIFYGSLLLFILGGFGMATVPVSFIALWFKRPEKPNAENMVVSDMIIRKDTEIGINKLKNLIEKQEQIEEMRQEEDYDKKAVKTKIENHNISIIQVQEMLIQLEELMSSRKKKHNIIDENPLKYLFFLFFGIFSGVISIIIIFHTSLSFFGIHVALEKIFFFLHNSNILFPLFFFVFISIYLLFCTIKGYEKLSELFPQILGHNQMTLNRTWIDTFFIIANIFIPVSWAIICFFLKFCPNFFSFTHASKLLKLFVLNVGYIKTCLDYGIFNSLFVFSFFAGLIITCSTSITKEELDKRIIETKENLKRNQFSYYQNNKIKMR